MTHRALLIGSQLPPLTGVERDLATMRSLLPGLIHGVAINDVYELSPAKGDPVMATVVAVGAVHALVELTLPTPGLVAGLPARPVQRAFRARPVRLGGAPTATAKLADLIDRSPFVRCSDDEPPMATIRAEDHQIDIRDGADGPVQTVADGRAALEALHHVARAAALRDLAGELEPPPWSRCLVRWGEVQGGRRGPPLPPRGSRVRAGAALWIAVENRADHDLWLTVLDLSIHGEVGMLTRVAPPGLWLRRGCEIVVGEVQGRLVGCPVSWPAEVPAGCADESLLVLAMDRACDLSGLVTVVAKDSSPLPNVLAPLARHPVSDKEIAPAKSAPLRVEVHAIDFVLDSAPAPGP